MRLGYVILYVKDVQKTVVFYEKAFGLDRRFIHESGTYAEMETGATALAFADENVVSKALPFRFNRSSGEAPGFEVSLVTDHVEELFDKAVQAGAIAVEKPTQKPWGQLVSYVRDNNGCLVEICGFVEK